MKKLLSVILAVVTALSLCAGFCSCGKNEDDGAGEKKTLIMATHPTFPPYEYVDGGNVVGIDAEIAAKIAGKLGMDLKIESVEFGAILSGVESGKYDIGMAGITVTEERLKTLAFSTSYATGIQVVIVKDGGPVSSLEDLKNEEIMIGVQQDTTGDIYASSAPENGGYGEDRVLRYLAGADAVQALVSGKVQAVITDNEPAKSYVAANEGLSILDTEWITEDYAIAINKGNTELLDKVNKALEELIADGTVGNIVNKYIPAE